jgi:glucokinase
MTCAGVDLGGTKIEAVVFGDDHAPVAQARYPTPESGGPRAVVEAIAAATRDAAASVGGVEGLAGVGVGSPGVVDTEAGTVTSARNLPDWEGTYPLGPALSEELGGLRVRVGNDVAVALEAELALGAGLTHSSFLGVWWGTGVGGSLFLNGSRLPGGEFGHTVVRWGGARCGCGRRGCLEAYAGRGSMERRARRLADKGAKTDLFKIARRRERERLTSGVWARALEEGDRVAERLIADAIEAIGIGAASIRNLIEYDAVVLGGGLGTRFADTAPERIAAAMQPQLFVPERAPAVVPAALGDLGGAVGAARLVSG